MHNALTPPWLADDAQLELTIKKGKTPLSHRRWPGEPVMRTFIGSSRETHNRPPMPCWPKASTRSSRAP